MGILLHEAFPLLDKIKHGLLKCCIWLHQCPVLRMHVMGTFKGTSWNLEALVGRLKWETRVPSGFAGGMTELSPVPLE